MPTQATRSAPLIRSAFPKPRIVKGPEIEGTLLELAKRVHLLIDTQGPAQYEIGTIYNHILDNRMAEKAGYSLARDYFVKEFKEIAQSTLSLYGSVAHESPRTTRRNTASPCSGAHHLPEGAEAAHPRGGIRERSRSRCRRRMARWWTRSRGLHAQRPGQGHEAARGADVVVAAARRLRADGADA